MAKLLAAAHFDRAVTCTFHMTKLRVYHNSFFTNTQNTFGVTDPNSVQDTWPMIAMGVSVFL